MASADDALESLEDPVESGAAERALGDVALPAAGQPEGFRGTEDPELGADAIAEVREARDEAPAVLEQDTGTGEGEQRPSEEQLEKQPDGKEDSARDKKHHKEKRSKTDRSDKEHRSDRDRHKDRSKDPEKDKSRDRERDRDRERGRSKDTDRERDRDRDRGRDRERDRDRGRDRDGDTDKGRERDRDRDRPRDVDRDRSGTERERDTRRRSRSREKSRPSRSTDRHRRSSHRSRSRDRSRRERSPSHSRRHRSRSRDRSRRRSIKRSRSKSAVKKERKRSPSREKSRRRSRSNSSDAFGGYVPRKRQEAPREGWWRAAGYSTSYVDPYAALRGNATQTTDPAELAKQMQEQQLRARQLVLQQQAASAVAAASKTQREVYVGNLVSGLVAEDALRQLFNSTMRAAFPDKVLPGLDPVVTVSLHSEGRYAFVELRTPEMASAALSLSNQVQLLGQPISVGRPSGYVDPAQAQSAAAAASAALAAFKAGDDQTMQEQMDLAGGMPAPQTTPPSLPQAAIGGAGGTPGGTGGSDGVPTVPGPTAYLQVEGMVTSEVLQDDEEYKEVIEDLNEECGKHGAIMRVHVPRPPNPEQSASLMGVNNYGKAYVSFQDTSAAASSKEAIHGRLFAGSTVQVTYITLETFHSITGVN